MRKIFRFFVALPKLTLAIFVVSALFLGFYSTKLEVDASSETLLLENDKDLEIWREVSHRYKVPNFLVIAFSPKNGDLFSAENLSLIRKISAEISKFDFVENVLNITNVPLLLNKKQEITELVKHVPTLNDADTDLEAAKKEFETSPFYASNLISKDLKTTAIVINLKPNLKYESLQKQKNILGEILKEKNATNADKIAFERVNSEFKIFRDANRIKEHNDLQKIRQIIAQTAPNELFLGGINMIADDMVSFVQNDIGTYGVASFALLIFCFWLFFRQAIFVLMPVIICVFSVIIASGLFGFLGFEITVISSNYVALQLIITVSVAIHLIVAYREYSLRFGSFSQKQIVYMTLKDRASPCFFAIFTTIVGFFSLIFCDIKPVIMLGIMMSVGISLSLIVAFGVFASVMSLRKRQKIVRVFEEGFKFTEICANFALNHKAKIYAVCVICVIVGLFGISKLKVENSFIGYFKSNTAIYKGMEVIDKELGGTVPLDIVVKFKNSAENLTSENSTAENSADEFMDEFEAEFAKTENDPKYWFDPHKMAVIEKIHDFLAKREFVGQVSSLASLLKVGKMLNNGVSLDNFMLAVMYNELPQNYKDIVLNPYINIENNEAHFSVRTLDSDPKLRRAEFLQKLKTDLQNLTKNDGVDVEISGVMVLYNNMLQSLMHSQLGTLGFTLLVLFVIFVPLFRSLKYAIIALLINLIPLCFGFGIMGFLGIPLDIMSITIAAISIGIGVDDVIHYIFRYKKELVFHKNAQIAVLKSHKSIGYAMYYTSFAIILGFCVMTISNFWPTIYFGLLIDLIMALLLLGALVILPALILSTKGLKF